MTERYRVDKSKSPTEPGIPPKPSGRGQKIQAGMGKAKDEQNAEFLQRLEAGQVTLKLPQVDYAGRDKRPVAIRNRHTAMRRVDVAKRGILGAGGGDGEGNISPVSLVYGGVDR